MHLSLALFILQNFKKFLEPIQSLVQTIIITFISLLALFTVQNFKIFLQQIQSYEDVPFWVQNDPFAPFDPLEFFRKPVNEQGLI